MHDISDRATERVAPGFVTSLGEGWSEVRSRSGVLGFLGGLSVHHAVVLPAILVLGPVLMAEEYGGARSWAIVTALFGLGDRPARASHRRLRDGLFSLWETSLGEHVPVQALSRVWSLEL